VTILQQPLLAHSSVTLAKTNAARRDDKLVAIGTKTKKGPAMSPSLFDHS